MEFMKDEFFDLIFDKMQESNKLNIEDKKLDQYRKENVNVSAQLYNFIQNRVHPKCRRQLLRILERRNETTSNYFFRENVLYYKSGFLQGMYIVTLMYDENNKKKDNWRYFYYSI